MSRAKNFPNDKRVTVLRKDLTKYTAWESQNLIKVHNWTPSAVRVHQLSYLNNDDYQQCIGIEFINHNEVTA